MSVVGVGLVDGQVPFVVTDSEIATFKCSMPVTSDGRIIDGRGDPLPLDERTEKCPHPTTLLVGSAPTCPCHIRMALTIGKVWPELTIPGECP